MLFSDLGLATDILRAVSDQGYTEPTPIQQQAIPMILAGRDVLASAQTGTGKTAGFTLPVLHRLSQSQATAAAPGSSSPQLNKSGKPVIRSKAPRLPRVLILTPTRELAIQVSESVSTYGRYMTLRSTAVYGGVGINPQIDQLRRGVDLLVATPGRLLDHVGQDTVDLSQIEMVVLDEADRMLDMGFIHDIRRILHKIPPQRQTLMFSATFSDPIKKLADEFLTDPALIEVARRNAPTENVSQVVHLVDRHRKRELLSYLIGSQNWRQVLVFTRTKHGANRLAEQLEKDGLTTAAIHGNKSQAARSRALSQFKQGSVRVLVATDVAARGLDIDQLPHVVNFELPNVAEDYVHRIGRTGRAGNSGQALSLVCVDEHGLLRDIERLLKQQISTEVTPGYEPDLSIAPEPIQMGRRPPAKGSGSRQWSAPSNRSGSDSRGRSRRRSDRPEEPKRVVPAGEASGGHSQSHARAESGSVPVKPKLTLKSRTAPDRDPSPRSRRSRTRSGRQG